MGVSKPFSPTRDLPSLDGKIIFITGGTAGLGKASIHALARYNPAHIYFTGRNTQRASTLIEDIKRSLPDVQLTFVQCDFESLDSIREGMKKVTHSKLDILICNAGIMAKPQGLSKDGYEVQFAVNHVAHALIIKLLLPALTHAASQPESDVRVVMLTSLAWRLHPKGGIQFSKLDTLQPFPVLGHWIRYGQSKLANLVYAAELARRYPEIITVSVHPGVVKTGLVEELGWGDRWFVYVTQFGRLLEEDQGALNQLWAAAGAKKDELVNGGFYLPVGEDGRGILDSDATSEKLASELWEWTEHALGKQ